MTVQLARSGRGSVPIHATDIEQFAAHTAALEPAARRWLQTSGFNGAPDTFALLPAPDGNVDAVWAGVGAGCHCNHLQCQCVARYRAGDHVREHTGNAGIESKFPDLLARCGIYRVAPGRRVGFRHCRSPLAGAHRVRPGLSIANDHDVDGQAHYSRDALHYPAGA